MASSKPQLYDARIPYTLAPELNMFMAWPFLPQGVHQQPASSSRTMLLQENGIQPPPPLSQPPSIPQQPPAIPPSHPQPSLSSSKRTTLHNPTTTTTTTTTTTITTDPSAAPAAPAAPAAIDDPRYMTMASRLAAYYRQRCEAVVRFQQERCRAWAAAQRQKSQEMMQAATVIVAWYTRERIARRRRKRKRAFKRGLMARGAAAAVGDGGGDDDGGGVSKHAGDLRLGGGGGGRIFKEEAVRRWVMGVPILGRCRGGGGGGVGNPVASKYADGAAGSSSPSTAGRQLPADKDEVGFDMDRERTPDTDTQLFNVADNIIKSHLARIDVPLLRVLSSDESESESESDGEEEDLMDYEDDEGEDGGEEENE
ncbi:hypothetical protein N658DRAFT_120360 [Parathielavia hyrcaniae]|uniref:Uncharacterized protein n=1 Tax=Parathielavia hyrcaniae TaxID=113614 RepID=A0AAN6T528_9PEZI|nr:hypothetical protein N658DRAFT_120360 [Parathielavia hyrcaniae]